MPGERRDFLDTNVLVYAFDIDEPQKREIAIGILSTGASLHAVSAQVLAEFYVTVTRKLNTPLSPVEAEARVVELSHLHVVSTDASLVNAAIALSRHESISYWDAAIVAAAASAGCERLISEDLHDGAILAGVRVENPFPRGP